MRRPSFVSIRSFLCASSRPSRSPIAFFCPAYTAYRNPQSGGIFIAVRVPSRVSYRPSKESKDRELLSETRDTRCFRNLAIKQTRHCGGVLGTLYFSKILSCFLPAQISLHVRELRLFIIALQRSVVNRRKSGILFSRERIYIPDFSPRISFNKSQEHEIIYDAARPSGIKEINESVHFHFLKSKAILFPAFVRIARGIINILSPI